MGRNIQTQFYAAFICKWLRYSIANLSIDNEIGRRRLPEVKFSRAHLVRIGKVVKTSSSFRRGRISGRFAVLAKT